MRVSILVHLHSLLTQCSRTAFIESVESIHVGASDPVILLHTISPPHELARAITPRATNSLREGHPKASGATAAVALSWKQAPQRWILQRRNSSRHLRLFSVLGSEGGSPETGGQENGTVAPAQKATRLPRASGFCAPHHMTTSAAQPPGASLQRVCTVTQEHSPVWPTRLSDREK